MTETHIFYNDQIIPDRNAKISPFTRGLHYGDGVFETMRSYKGKVFYFHEHAKRLKRGLEILKIKSAWDDAEILYATKKLLEANNLSDSAINQGACCINETQPPFSCCFHKEPELS